MKKNYLLLILVLALNFQHAFAQAITNHSLLEQLENLNSAWLKKEMHYPELKNKPPLINEVELIRLHLKLVETALRNTNTNDLSIVQKKNRKNCLDILHNYRMKGVFPKNLYHTKRTPYFIDKFGTACAVGQLIISTGHKSIAYKISRENNYAYIKELNLKYREISEWAVKFGFTMEELAWIQPTYCNCTMSGPGMRNNTCNRKDKNPINQFGASYDGYFQPWVTGYPEPYTYEWFYINWSGEWQSTPCGGCNLWPGEFKCTVTDGDGFKHDYFHTITEPEAISTSITCKDENGTCNGTAIIVTKGGTPGYSYRWGYDPNTWRRPWEYTNGTIHNLCRNSYGIETTDSVGCKAHKQFKIGLTINSALSVMPNPGQGIYSIIVSNPSENAYIEICNSLGVIIYKSTWLQEKNSIDLSGEASGLYILKLMNGDKVIELHKIIKE